MNRGRGEPVPPFCFVFVSFALPLSKRFRKISDFSCPNISKSYSCFILLYVDFVLCIIVFSFVRLTYRLGWLDPKLEVPYLEPNYIQSKDVLNIHLYKIFQISTSLEQPGPVLTSARRCRKLWGFPSEFSAVFDYGNPHKWRPPNKRATLKYIQYRILKRIGISTFGF